MSRRGWRELVGPDGVTLTPAVPGEPVHLTLNDLDRLRTAVSLERLATDAPWDDAVTEVPAHEVGGEGG